jgi:hypothetical protein
MKNQIRESQVISTYGPGSMVDFPDGSVIIAGLDQWEYQPDRIPVVNEPRLTEKLRRILQVSALTLRKPPPASDQPHGLHPKITGFRFPEWFIVQFSGTSPQGFRRRKLVNQNALNNNRYRDDDGENKNVVPIRFVRACEHGHIGDIDWKSFIHGAHSDCPRQLWMEERGTSGDLSEIWLTCDCGAQRAMSQAARRELKALGQCNGSRPWLGAGTRERCGKDNRLLIRSASNAYFPEIMSVISIPDPRGAVDGVVTALWDDFFSQVNTMEDLQREKNRRSVAERLQGLNDDAVLAAIQRRRNGLDEVDRPVKEAEFEALSTAAEEIGVDEYEGDFYARSLPRQQWESPWLTGIERIVLIHRLREVAALVGFTRFESRGTDIQGELSLDVQRAPIAIHQNWLPAVENRGEGIFIQFNNDTIRTWLNKPEVRSRGTQLQDGFTRWAQEHQIQSPVFPGLPYYFLHSISHLLMMSISLECGYPASSLKERIYVGSNQNGILLFTGSSDAEGTLGGLIMAGKDIRRHFWTALEMGTLCSNDPVCALHIPGIHDHQQLIGSACHGCLLVSETSCEQRNELLDRALVVPTIDNIGANFFKLT